MPPVARDRLFAFFGGFDIDAGLCESTRLVSEGYASGVPMGGEFTAAAPGARPGFVVSAVKDPGIVGRPGNDLQRIQIIKGWLDADGNTHEEVYDVAGDKNNRAWVDANSCQPTGSGASSLCAVWEDANFDPGQRAFYYARVLENPSCRWSTLHCQAAGVNPFADNCTEQATALTARLQEEQDAIGDVYGNCCKRAEEEPFYSPVIQERAWTSPIWYRAGEAE